MKLRSKLLINAFVPLVLAFGILIYIVIRITSLQTSTSGLVDLMMKMQEMKGSMILGQQALSNYSFHASENNKAEASAYLKQADEQLEVIQNQLNPVQNLRSMAYSIGEAGAKIDLTANEIETENQTLTKIVEQIAIATDELATGNQNVSEDIVNVVTLVEDLQQGFVMNLQVSNESSAQSKGAAEAVAEGQKAVGHQEQLIKQNRESMHVIQQSVNDLAESASEIQSLTGLVTDIAQ